MSLKFVFLGLTITSAWGNGHATTYRSLVKGLAARGNDVLFLERDVPWYAANRDLPRSRYCRIELYSSMEELRDRFAPDLREADLALVGSYVPEGVAVARWALATARRCAFYDIDTPLSLADLERRRCEYLAPELIPDFDLYLSFSAGPVLDLLERRYGARRARALHCSIDPDQYAPRACELSWDLGYLGTYSPDRQAGLRELLLSPARQRPALRAVVAGPQYPDGQDWPPNVGHVEHLPPPEHAAFYCAQRFTLNLTRADMRRAGWSPSVRLFEAGACGTPVVTDPWPGLEQFFRPGLELLVACSGPEVLRILDTPDAERRQIGRRARERVLSEHTADRRAGQLEEYAREAIGRRPGW